jgi:hypothetical protein
MYNIPRVECGFLGINEEQCKDRGCCWKESDTPGEPWCFKSGQVAERCDTVGMKTDCGQVGTTQEECESKGCCWEKSDEENTPWCFHRIQLNE